ncbi:MAG: CRISPR-associated endonuclease Cas1 [Desulfurococcaceae archaeon]
MRSLVISGYGVRLRYRKGLLLIESRDRRDEVPIADLDQVIVATGGVWLSSKVVRKLAEHGVDLLFLDSRGMPSGRVYPPFVSRTVETRRAQYTAYGTDAGTAIMKEIVRTKLANQSGLLRRYYRYVGQEELRELANEIASMAIEARELEAPFEEARERLRSIEAEAARLYWAGFSLLVPADAGFEGRDQDSADPVNSCLNYAYGILYAESWRALVLAGLDPYAGFLHVDRSGRPVLAFDFVEMFRFAADLALLNLLRHGWRPKLQNGLLDYGSRSKIVEAVNDVLERGRARYLGEAPASVRQAMKKAAIALASFLRGEGRFEGFVYGW